MQILKDMSLASYTSWQIGGKADFLILPSSIDELVESLKWADSQRIPVSILGGGSNVLVSDRGIRGLTICLKKMTGIEDNGHELVCLAGTSKSDLLKIYLKKKLISSLFLAGIPGDVGGGVVMNAGVSENINPKEFCEIVKWIEVIKPNYDFVVYHSNDLQWSYRHCKGWQPGVITKVSLKCDQAIDEKILEKVKEANRLRLSKQPLDKPSCGSVFQNPVGAKAAQLIEQCGLKGQKIGQAEVSSKHANFIVNNGGATAQDTWHLVELVQETVKKKKNIELLTEVIRLGDW